jgi:hypothetical protein
MLQTPFEIEGLEVVMDASVGVALCPDDGVDADSLLQRADVAMYQAKESRTGFQAYDPSRDRHSRERHGREVAAHRHELAFAIRKAVAFLFASGDARVRLREVDDRQHDFVEAPAFEQQHEARLDAPPPRCLFDQQRSRAGWISESGCHKAENLLPDVSQEEVFDLRAAIIVRPFLFEGAHAIAPLPSVVVVMVAMRAVDVHGRQCGARRARMSTLAGFPSHANVTRAQ